MKLDANKLSSAVRLALSLGAVASVGSAAAFAQDAQTSPNTKGQSLETIVVTGSNIRRVDIETASPVVTIDRAQIQASGKVNLGDLVQQLPSMAGAAMNPQVNNGGVWNCGRFIARSGFQPHLAADQRSSHSVPVAGSEHDAGHARSSASKC